jgi:MscS family membrane protein
MKTILQQVIFENTVQTYLSVAVTIIVALIVKRFVSKYLAYLLYKIFSKAGKTFHKQSFLDLIVGPLEWFLALFIIVVALDKLHLPSFLDFSIYRANTHTIIDAVANATLIIVFIRLCIRMVLFFAMILEEKASASQEAANNQLIVFFKDFLKVVLIMIGGLLILRFSFNYNVSNLLTGLSLVGAAIALATKESLENLIASFIIFFDKPFTMGDTVKVNGFTGAIERIGLRSTRIRTDQKTYITVPNKQMVDSILDNITLRSQRKVELRLEIGLSATVEELKQVITAIKKMLEQEEQVLSKTVFVSDTGRTAHIVTVDYFTSMEQSNETFNDFRQQINLSVIALLAQMNVALAAASTDVVVHTAVATPQA